MMINSLSLPNRWLRRLLPLLCLFTLAMVVWLGPLGPSVAQTPRQEIRGVWFTMNDFDTLRDRAKMQQALSQLRQLNFNTIYPVVWNAGYVLHPSATAQQLGIQPFVYQGTEGQDILAELAAEAHRQGLTVIPWFEFGFMTPPSSELAIARPQWLTTKADGTTTSVNDAGEVAWLNPFRPEVQQFITNLVLEVVTQYDVDGIQFDDHMALPNEFGYDPYTVALHQRETGRAPDPNHQATAWVKWRADKITAFMTQLHKAVKARKPNAIFALSPNYYNFAYKLHLQDWLTWVRKGLLDELVMQVYRTDLPSFVEQINRPEVQETQKKIPTGIGILTGLRSKPMPIAQVQAQTQAAQDQQLGVAYFYYETLWQSTPEPAAMRQAAFQSLFPYPAVRSTM